VSNEKTGLTPEVLVPRLGEYLVQQGHIDQASLQRALALQQEASARGRTVFLGQALLDLGLLDRATVDQAITEQIIQLRNALENANHSLEKRVQERTADLQEALRKLSELSQLKSNFIANISHELRTPLTHIKGYLELLVTETLGLLTDEQRHALEVSQRSAGRLENLINNLILFSLASRGKMSLHLAPVDLSRIAGEIVGYSRSKAADKHVELVNAVQPSLPPVNADAQMISWVIMQLLDNAIKFTQSGGRVTLSIEAEAGSIVQVTVSDTGIGIPRGRIDEIFEPFHQLDGSSTRQQGGTGLGLSLVREILDAHGSVIEVQSEVGKGSRFRFPLIPTDESM